jgi:hypothetical protein
LERRDDDKVRIRRWPAEAVEADGHLTEAAATAGAADGA